MTIKFGNFANFIVRNFAVIWEAPKQGKFTTKTSHIRAPFLKRKFLWGGGGEAPPDLYFLPILGLFYQSLDMWGQNCYLINSGKVRSSNF